MMVKFDHKCHRVKGVAFHPTRPWVVASLHNGSVHLFNYQMGALLDKFEEHEGPVRGVDFHKTQPLIVSGGDDFKVKVWDYKLRRCLYTLLGHLDYIRTTQFHSEYPWIVSASDDQTIRIWNWMSRTCISVLTGHNHYVMSASFHPKEDLIVSASLDQTVRVWDTTGLRKKTVRGAPSSAPDDFASKVNNELFGGNDAVVKYVLEGHDRGVNWASFHPSLPYIVSGADDKQVKLWRMSESKAWEVDAMRGHANNVSCAVFHPKQELIISNSEDKTIRVWDMGKRTVIRSFRRDNDRYWVLAVHATQSLIAAGHDNGLVVFKLERERPAMDMSGDGKSLFYVRDRYLRQFDVDGSGRDLPMVSLRRYSDTSISGAPRSLHFNSYNRDMTIHNVLVFSDADGGIYDLVSFTADGGADASDIRRGAALSVAFLTRNRFACLDKSRSIIVKSLENDAGKRLNVPISPVDQIYFGGTSGRLLLKSEDKIFLFDTQSRKVLGESSVTKLKYVVWSNDGNYVALLGKHSVTLANRQLETCCTLSETTRVKSGAWDSGNRAIFVYATFTHIKYVIPSGDCGIIRGIEVPLYLFRVAENQVQCLDRDGRVRVLEADISEALFKLALDSKNYAEVIAVVQNGRLCGQAIISYLQQKGYPEVALHFVTDSAARFDLALACGNIEVASAIAYDLNDDKCWSRLATEALKQGNHTIVETALQKTKNYERLSFLYVITGNTDKLRKMSKIATVRGDGRSRFHNSLFLGDAEERVAVLESNGQLSLAYIAAVTHGLEAKSRALKEKLEAYKLPIPATRQAGESGASGRWGVLLQPPTPIMRLENWPLLNMSKSVFDVNAHQAVGGKMIAADVRGSNGPTAAADGKKTKNKSSGGGKASDGKGDDDDDDVGGYHDAVGSGWAKDDDLMLSDDDDDDKAKKAQAGKKTAVNVGSVWDQDNDLDLDDDDDDDKKKKTTKISSSSSSSSIQAADSIISSWVSTSSHAADHAASGSMTSAMTLLKRQIGASDFTSLKPHLLDLVMSSKMVVPGMPLSPPLMCNLVRSSTMQYPALNEKGNYNITIDQMPRLHLKPETCVNELNQASDLFTEGKFDDAMQAFRGILSKIPLTVAATRTEANNMRELCLACKEYITALRLKTAMTNCGGDKKREIELGVYLTHCSLQSAHVILVLKLALSTAYKSNNFITSAGLARRLLELPDLASERHADLRTKTQKVLQKSEQQGRNEVSLDYDERNPFQIDCQAFKPLYRGGQAILMCSYCQSAYGSQAMKRQICETCRISLVGEETLGLVTSSIASTR